MFTVDADPQVLVLAAFVAPRAVPEYIRLCVDHRDQTHFCFQWGQHGAAVPVPAQIIRKVIRVFEPGDRWIYHSDPERLEICRPAPTDRFADWLQVGITSPSGEVIRYLRAAETQRLLALVSAR